MKLVMLYGPPAVGKLSVAKALAARTGFRLLHNHLLIDLSRALFEFGGPAMTALTRHLREVSLDAARKEKLSGVILTYVYAQDRDGYILGLCERSEAAGDEVCLVQLTCSVETLEARVTEPLRREFGKLTTVEGLREKLRKLDEPFGAVDGRDCFVVKTDNKTPAEVAAGIIDNYIAV